MLFSESEKLKIMASALKNLSQYDEKNIPDASKMKFGIVVADWNAEITHALYEGCYDVMIKHGADPSAIHTIQVPGAFELTSGAKFLLKSKAVDAVVCLGCVIQGETKHNDYINNAVANGLTQLGLLSDKPCIFGVLTPNDMQQAKDRSGGKYGNKGVEAGVTAIRMASLKSQLGVTSKKIGFGS